MIRSLRAFVWLRWRLVMNGVRGGHRRDTVERISRALALGLPFVVVALSIGSVVALGILGFVGGSLMAADATVGPLVLAIARLVLAGMFVVLVIFAFTSPIRSAMARYSRLLLLPISRRTLHVVEILAGLADPWVAFLIPGLVTFAIALVVGGSIGTGLIAGVAGVLLVAVLATFGATAGMLVSLLLRNRRRGEMVTLVFIIAFSLASFVPIFLAQEAERREEESPSESRPTRSIDDVDRALPVWTRALPSELYGRAVRGGLDGEVVTSGLALGGLLLQAVLLFAASSAVHARLIGSTGSERGRRGGATVPASAWRLPGVAPTTMTVAQAQVRTALRTVRGRAAVLMPGPVFAIVMMMLSRTSGDAAFSTWQDEYGFIVFAGGLFFALLSLAPFTMNLFASDRSGLTMQLLSPVTDVQLARGKLLGCGLVAALAGGLCLGAALFVAPTGSVSTWVSVGLGGAAAFQLFGPVAIWMSALFPTPADLSRMGSAGNPHTVASFVGFAGAAIVTVPPAAIVAATLALGVPGVMLPLMLGWLALTAVVAIPLTRVASRAVGLRRENLALVAQGR